ncbi:ATP-grasp domain-containing protein [Pseudomonas peli]|uniref:ATP-grasp domain-containing protein n=1 Tax=Pseudomonas peli TaxID=592361 RepID=UPI0024AD943E|nr:ATP-grasp domain-containing protein [Pseudomonas peli]
MKKVLVVSSSPDIEQRLARMVEKGAIPKEDYSIFVEKFGEESSASDGHFANVFTIDDLRNRVAIDAGVEQCRAWGPFDLVITTDEYSVILAAELRDRLAIPGPKLSEMLKFRDKVIMKESLLGSSVPTPAFYTIEQLLNDHSLLPVVVKPRSYAGSKGISVLNMPQEVLELANTFQGTLTDKEVAFTEFSLNDLELEEFIVGEILHIDGYILGGEVIFCVPSQYVGTCLNYINGQPLASHSVEDREEHKRCLEFSKQVHAVMQLPDGAFHLEAFLTSSGERVFLEIGARPGGSYVVPSIEYATGLNLDVAHIQCQLGIAPKVPGDDSEQFGWVVFPKQAPQAHSPKVREVSVPDLSGYLSPTWTYLPTNDDDYTGNFFSYTSNLGAFVFNSLDHRLMKDTLQHLMMNYRVGAEHQ